MPLKIGNKVKDTVTNVVGELVQHGKAMSMIMVNGKRHKLSTSRLVLATRKPDPGEVGKLKSMPEMLQDIRPAEVSHQEERDLLAVNQLIAKTLQNFDWVIKRIPDRHKDFAIGILIERLTRTRKDLK